MSMVLLALRSFFFYVGFYSSLLVYACLCLTIGPFLAMPARYRFFLHWNDFVLFWLKFCCGISVHISGRENIPDHAVVVLSNHQSPWETIYLYRLFSPVSAILKKQLLRIPFFGWALSLLKPIAIDRSKKLAARKAVMEQGSDRLARGISIVIFPEGTRVAPGKEKPYQTGGTALAIETGSDILPVAHNAGLFWPSGKFIKFPGIISLVIGKPISSTGQSPRELTREIESWIKNAL